jgi:hypothetical protein
MLDELRDGNVHANLGLIEVRMVRGNPVATRHNSYVLGSRARAPLGLFY